MDGLGNVRYGVELEGAYKGFKTLVLLAARYHTVAEVHRLRASHLDKPVEHLWLQCEPGERYNWVDVAALWKAGYAVTVQVRHPEDLPPRFCSAVSCVWRIPPELADVAARCRYATYMDPGGGPFAGNESALEFRKFDQADYQKDEVWE